MKRKAVSVCSCTDNGSCYGSRMRWQQTGRAPPHRMMQQQRKPQRADAARPHAADTADAAAEAARW